MAHEIENVGPTAQPIDQSLDRERRTGTAERGDFDSRERSPNPLVRFPLRVARSGTLRVVFTNSEGQRWEAMQPLRV